VALPLSFGNLTGGETVVGYIIYDFTSDIPVCHVDSVSDRTLQGDPFSVEFPNGVLEIG